MSTTDKKLLSSLASFTNDIKPYHSKLRGFTTEISFSDKIAVRVIEELAPHICVLVPVDEPYDVEAYDHSFYETRIACADEI